MSEEAKESAPGANNEVAPAEQGGPAQQNDVATDQGQQQQQQQHRESPLSIIKSLILRGLFMYFIFSFFRGKSPPPNPTNNTAGPILQARNIFADGTPLSLHIYLSESETLENFHYSNLFCIQENIVYGDWTGGANEDGTYEMQKNVPITEHMKNNGSLYLHTFITALGNSPDPKAKSYVEDQTIASFKQLNRFKQVKAKKTKNLLTGEAATEQKDVVADEKPISHWHPNLTINLVVDQTLWSFGAVPQPLDQFISFSEDFKHYKPILYPNDFWNLAKEYQPLNETYSLKITYQPLSLFKWQMYAAQSMRKSMFPSWGADESEHSDDDQDTLKETLMDTNPYLLGITMAVTFLHSIFELLAFKNDIQFWKNRNSLEGLSVRTVFFSVFQSLVVLLYVLDNDSNTLIRISCFVGLGIELWKICKVVDIKFENGRPVFKDKGSYTESSTKQYDELAFKYLSWLCFPLLAGYCVYALLYLEHKGWYSFVLDILYGYLLTFGFIMMTPQLFINYKLKSVAHLPWRMLTYKFLNTFLDDMFAFVIKMPTLYRIGCFRDDIVFLIFLYQKWIYPVDKSRMNEFGFSAEGNDEQKAVAAAGNGEVVAITSSSNSNSQETKKDL